MQHDAGIVHLRGAEALAVYDHNFYAGSSAVTVNQFGEGRAYYLAARHDDRFLADFYTWLEAALSLEKAVGALLPAGVTAQVRKAEKHQFVFLLDFNPSPQLVRLDNAAATDVLTGKSAGPEISLPG